MNSLEFRDILPLILSRRSPQDIVAFFRTNKSNYRLNNPEFWTKLIRTRWGNVLDNPTIQQYRTRYQQDVDLLVDSAANHKCKMIRQLVNRGIDLDSRNANGSTALIEAVSKSHGVIVKYLLDLGVDVNITDRNNVSALMMAAWKGNGSVIVSLLIKAGADVNHMSPEGVTSLSLALNRYKKESVGIVLKLVQVGADVNSIIHTRHDDTMLTWAAKMNAVDLIKILLEIYNVNINQRGQSGGTALIWAVRESNLEAVQTLLSYNPDLTIRDKWDKNALEWAEDRYSKYSACSRIKKIFEMIQNISRK